ncbi:MAG: hypothetical protein P4M05_33400 [Bradyrhizobium sp.]|nr:hypothetical protein [Bradyrhizobium sp.]
MKYSLRCMPVIVVLAGLAMVAAGCSDSRMAANNAAANSDEGQPVGERTGYGTRSGGYTTDVYTELKGSLQRAPRPQTAASVPVQQQGQPATPAGSSGQQVAASGPSVVQQQPAGPPPEDPTPTAYGISSDGPTTDVATWLFGPRNH